MYQIINEGEQGKWGYGCAYYKIDEHRMVLVIMPFNHVVRWIRNLYWWLGKGRPNRFDTELFKEYHRGLNNGYNQGCMDTMQIYNKKLERYTVKKDD